MFALLWLLLLLEPATGFRPQTQRSGQKGPALAVSSSAGADPRFASPATSVDTLKTAVLSIAADGAVQLDAGANSSAVAPRPIRRRVKDAARTVVDGALPKPSPAEELAALAEQAESAIQELDRAQAAIGKAAAETSVSTTAAAAVEPTASPDPEQLELARKLLLQDVVQRNASALGAHLEGVKDEEQGRAIFEEPFQASTAQDPWMHNTTLLGIAARLGWVDGVRNATRWRISKVGQKRLQLGVTSGPDLAGCHNNTALHLAVINQSSEVVSVLLGFGASALVLNSCGETVVETAFRTGAVNLASIIIQSDPELSEGFTTLRRSLAKAPPTTWPSGEAKGEEDKWRDMVPHGARPQSDEDIKHVGRKPGDWILHFQCRVMCAFSSASARSADVGKLLASLRFDTFARMYSASVLIVSFICTFFFAFVFMITKLKVYGWVQAPVSLAETIPGAFDPVRLADPDFDPSRVRGKLPYREARVHFNESLVPRVMQAGSSFGQALCGVYCSWLLQHVRIPPEKDPFDEDYLSDDDENCRMSVRNYHAGHAKFVQRAEIAVRSILLVLLVTWLLVAAARWDDAYLLFSMMVVYSMCVACVAGMTVPKAAPEQVPHELDAARLVWGIFSVQHGPRWTRSITTTRSTATIKKPKAGARRSVRPAAEVRQPNSKDDEDSFTMETIQALNGHARRDLTVPSFSDRFCHGFLVAGKMHVWHGELLVGQIVYICIIGCSMLWLLHLRHWTTGSFVFFYEDRSPLDLFKAYGTPGSFFRTFVVGLEVVLFGTLCERLYGLCMLLHVAVLTVIQRRRAMEYLRDNQPPATVHSDSVANVKEAIVRMDEHIRCGDFALELSSTRWAILRGPCELVQYFIVALYVLADLVHLGEDVSRWLASLGIDPSVPLSIANCLFVPMFFLLIQASTANKEVQRARAALMNSAAEALAATPATAGSSDVEYVTLRMKSTQALSSSVLRWPEGREVRCLDSVIFCILALASNVFMFL